MRSFLRIGGWWIATALSMHAAEFFVAPAGSDENPGTLESPFASIQRAQKDVAPGDTVFVRGGTYQMKESQLIRRRGPYAVLTFLEKSGTPEKRIAYRAYQREKPVFDCSQVKPEGRRVTAFLITGSWLHLQGLEVTGVQVTIKRHTQSICFDNEGSNNLYETLSMHDGMAIGMWIGNGSNNLVLNCDAYRNWDSVSEDGRGGNVDGFGYHGPKGSVNNVFRGCRAWFNSDDGYDCLGAAEPVIFENCWAFYNGLSADGKKLGDANGFKAGGYGTRPVSMLPSPIPHHIIRGCLAVGNRASGFYANHHLAGCDWFNNTALGNGTNFNFLGRLADNVTDVPGSGHRIRNNVSYASRMLVSKFNPAANEADHNTFAPEMKLTDRDFVSLDETQLTLPRQTDGKLPVITLMHLAPDSALIDSGVDIGLPFNGPKPDLGAFER